MIPMDTYLQEGFVNLMKGYEGRMVSEKIRRGIKARRLRLEKAKMQQAKK